MPRRLPGLLAKHKPGFYNSHNEVFHWLSRATHGTSRE